MLRATTVVRRAELGRRITIDTVTLDREARYRRRIAMESDRGHKFLLDLAEATYLEHGDALELSNGALVKVQAAPEDLLEIHARGPLELARIACRAGFIFAPACTTCPMTTESTSEPTRLARLSAALTTAAPRSGAAMPFNAPP
jgi:urease accessory protein